MAKISKKHRETVVEKMVVRYRAQRDACRQVIKDGEATDEEKQLAYKKLRRLPRNSSHTRFQRRCQLCGRPHAVYRKFKLCRICLRERAMAGDVTGVTTSSW